MEQKNLFDLFGITIEDLEKKAAKKNKDKQGKTKPEKYGRGRGGNKYALPVTVYGCGYSFTVSDEEEKEIPNDRLLKLLSEHFRGLEAFTYSVKQTKDKALIILQPLKEEADKDKVIGEVTICYGDTEMHFCGGTMDEAKKAWCEEHPEFIGCQMAYNEKKQVVLPFFASNTTAGKLYDTPIQIGIMQHILQIEEEKENVKLESLKESYLKVYPFYEGCSFFDSEAKNLLIPVMEEPGKKKSDKIKLPITVRAALSELDYGPEDFDGKSCVSLEEIRMKLEQTFPEYSKERTIMEYDEHHFIIPILKGSTKGVIVRSRDNNYALYEVKGRDGEDYRIEKTPVGEFTVCLSKADEKPEFHFALPKIPVCILEEVLQFFLKNKEHEAACQLFYSRGEGYTIYYPEQRYSIAEVSFKRDHVLESLKILVMDLHSHGRMQAFFSRQDDRDEKGTRLFLVAGNFDKEPQICIRAGIIGCFVDVKCEDIFS